LHLLSLVFIILLSAPLFGEINSYWLKLLHYKDGKSQIDDNSFFLSPIGKDSPIDELLATLNSIEHGNPKDTNSIQCLYPARTKWLKEQFPTKDIEECEYLEQHLKKFDFRTLYLVYASSYMNSPASMVGHTFLRFDKDDSTPLLSYALNYSAKIDDNISILSYAYNGVFGGFEGRYSVAPYYEMVKLYSDMEHRDIWEYKLKLTPKEIERAVLHMIEMQRYYSLYYFSSDNCSYNLLWFIELAKGDLKLVDRFNYITAPMDTIKELKREGLIEKSIFRPSKSTQAKAIYAQIDNKKIAMEFLATSDISIIQKLNRQEQIDIINLYLKNKHNKEILKYRSRLGMSKKREINASDNPIHANRASKFNTGLSNNKKIIYGARASYHDIYDIDYDFNQGSYISFFNLQMRESRIESLGLIKIDSLTPEQDLYKPFSWGIDFGLKRDKKLGLNLEGKIGKSYTIFDTILFIEPTLSMSYRDSFGLTFGYYAGLLKQIDRIKIGLLLNQNSMESFLTYQIKENIALHLNISKESNRFELFYYF
jgi:hypothetical protein